MSENLLRMMAGSGLGSVWRINVLPATSGPSMIFPATRHRQSTAEAVTVRRSELSEVWIRGEQAFLAPRIWHLRSQVPGSEFGSEPETLLARLPMIQASPGATAARMLISLWGEQHFWIDLQRHPRVVRPHAGIPLRGTCSSSMGTHDCSGACALCREYRK
jgi:hypothetical protein